MDNKTPKILAALNLLVLKARTIEEQLVVQDALREYISMQHSRKATYDTRAI